MATGEPLSGSLNCGFAIWFTGLPASGKTTVANALRTKLELKGIHSVIIDSDEMRKILTPHPTYSATERDLFYAQLAQLTEWLTNSGVNVLVAATAHRRAYRDAARQRIPRFAEIHVSCSNAECSKRDPKGLYKRAAEGKIDALPGVGSNYEEPLHPEAVIVTDIQTPDQAADALLDRLTLLI